MPDLTLGFDTSAAHCAAALLIDGRLLAARHEDMARGQAERLMAMLEELLSETGHGWHDLSVIGVGTGPGNFTGLRVSVAAARGLSLALGIPAIGISVTEAMAYGLPRPCRVVIEGRKDDVIWQDFFEDGDSATLSDPRSSPRESLPKGPQVMVSPTPLAEAIAHLAHERRNQPQPRPAPIYLRPADAAPARDRGPVILP